MMLQYVYANNCTFLSLSASHSSFESALVVGICRNQAACSIQATYCFPQWFLARTIYVVAAKTCTGDPMFSITTQRRVDPARQDTIIRLAETGNTEGVKIMLNKREAHPDDVD